MINKIFWHPDEKRLRMVWRLIISGIVFIGLTTVFTIPIVIVYMIQHPEIMQTMDMTNFPIGSTAIVSFVSAMATIFSAGFLLDRRKFIAFGFTINKEWWKNFFFGLLLGAGLMLLIFLIELVFGWITIEGMFITLKTNSNFLLGFIGSFIVFITVGIYEEALFRGYLVKNMSEGFKTLNLKPRTAVLIAWITSSAIFGIAHATNPNASLISTLNIMLAGIFLGLGYVLTGELGTAIGIHITWNFFQGNIFGFPVSGTSPSANIFDINQSGQDIITGGKFGPEAGLIGIFAILVGCGLILLRHYLKNKNLALAENIAEYQPRQKKNIVVSE